MSIPLKTTYAKSQRLSIWGLEVCGVVIRELQFTCTMLYHFE